MKLYSYIYIYIIFILIHQEIQGHPLFWPLPRYPSRYEQVLSALCESMEALDEPEAKASMIWILGEYAPWITGEGGTA